MPLAPGNSRAVISENIHELTQHGSRPRSHDQIVAIALSNADRHPHAASGFAIHAPQSIHLLPQGKVPQAKPESFGSGQTAPWFMRREASTSAMGRLADGGVVGSDVIHDMPFHGGGFINSSVAGRTDRLPLALSAESHVVPADVVSAAGQGNSLAGAKILQAALRGGAGVLGGEPPDVAAPSMRHRANLPHANVRPPRPFQDTPQRATGSVLGGSSGGIGLDQPQSDIGGDADFSGGGDQAKRGGHGQTSILAAGGELVATPAEVEAVGRRAIRTGTAKRGETALQAGHRLIDEMIAKIREWQIKWLKQAPKPKT